VRAARPPDARGRGSGARDRRPRLLRPAGRSGIIGLVLSTGDYSTATAGLTLTSNQSRAEGSSYRPMLTIFAVPKPFKGHVGVIQRNALGSWVRLAETVILFGDEEGIADAARDLGARHVPEVARNRFGTPLVDGVFGKARTCRHEPARDVTRARFESSSGGVGRTCRHRTTRTVTSGRRHGVEQRPPLKRASLQAFPEVCSTRVEESCRSAEASTSLPLRERVGHVPGPHPGPLRQVHPAKVQADSNPTG
jgi:hypothetical protein